MSNSIDFLNKGVELNDKQIHIFLFRLEDFDEKELYGVLSEDEKERADRLKVELKKKQFILARSLLRKLLSNSTDIRLDEIEFYYGEHDKPFIKNTYKNIEFNLSHSDQCIVIAITLENKVGVDVEKINTEIDHDSLSKRFFSKEEYSYLIKLNNNNKLDAFYRIWTRKEAFIKATGEGIAFGLDNFSVFGDSTKVEIKNEKNSNEDWYCFDLMNIKQYESALVSNNKDVELIFYP